MVVPPPPTLNDLKPYLGALLFTASTKARDAAMIDAALAEIELGLKTKSPMRLATASAATGLWCGALVYTEERTPAWWDGGPREQKRELVVVAGKGAHFAVCASDGSLRDRLAVTLKAGTPVERSEMARAFVGPEAKTAWLNGIHAPSDVKADAKMLSGHALEFAIDPLGDQSYFLSALRSRPTIAGLSRTRRRKKIVVQEPAVLGTAPGRARVWLGRPKSWSLFTQELEALLDHLAAGKAVQAPSSYKGLATEIDTIGVLGNAYAISLLPAEITEEDEGVDPVDLELARRWAYATHFDITPGSNGDFDADVSIDGAPVGTVSISLEFDPRTGRAALKASWTKTVPKMSKLRAGLLQAITKRGGSKVYYDCGHSFADDRLFAAGLQDRVFDWTTRDFSSWNIHREKPVVKGKKLVDAILSGKDTSLFDYVIKTYGGQGILACDDGAMEVADFIHLDTVTGSLTLIHVKAAGGKKRKKPGDLPVSVSDYEIVASQAVKNVRHLETSHLLDRLKAGADHEMKRATWVDGVPVSDRSALFAALANRKSSAKCEVIILQPRLTQTEIDHCKQHPASKRGQQFKQLNALMLGTRQAIVSCGGTFTVLAKA